MSSSYLLNMYVTVAVLFVLIGQTAAGVDGGRMEDILVEFKAEMERRFVALETENRELRTQINQLKNRQRRQWSNVPEVGFTATISKHLKSLGANQPIVFDQVITSIGTGYDRITGTFIAPYPGTYMFYATIMSETGGHIETQLVKNGVWLSNIYSGGSPGYDSTGDLVIVKLEKGDHVWIKVHNNFTDNHSIHGSFSSFSGYLLRHREEQEVVG